RQVPVPKGLLREDGLGCHKALQLMGEQEQRLLERRNTDSRQQSQLQMITEISVSILSLIAFFILFGFLYRDARNRAWASRELSKANTDLAQTVEVMEAHAIQARLLADGRHELQLCTTAEQIYQSAAMHLGRLLPGTAGAFCMLNNSRNFMESVAMWHAEGLSSAMLDIFDPQACCGIRSGSQRWRRPGVAELDCRHFTAASPERYVCMPLMAHGETLGVVCIQCVNDEAVAVVEKRSDSLQQFVQLTAMAVASLRLRTRLENQSIRDPLTGLFNRHLMQIAFDRELARATRRHNTLAVFMLDVDHFKRFNDQHGHAAGDAALQHVAEILSSQVRSEDTVCRYGGEEFVIILPEITAEAAYDKAESIRRAISEVRVELGQGRTAEVTISIGIAVFPREGERQEDLLREADKALYAAKHNGRNRVVVAAAVPERCT
ncbi:MAG TPA: sensor domain-containing diguanylate cyclase, partial [Candidatus Koribacter sp.]